MSDTSARTDARPVQIETTGEFEELLAHEDRVLVEFYTRNCSMCDAMEPVLGNVARATDVTVALVNGGDLFSLSSEYRIGSVPALLLFEDGEEIDRLAEGFVGADRVIAFLDSEGA